MHALGMQTENCLMSGECLTKSAFQMLASERYDQRYDPALVRSRLLLAIELFKQPDKIAIERALHLAEEVHRNSMRFHENSQKFIVHPMRVALILIEELKISHPEPVSAALLHNVVEDEKVDTPLSTLRKSSAETLRSWCLV